MSNDEMIQLLEKTKSILWDGGRYGQGKEKFVCFAIAIAHTDDLQASPQDAPAHLIEMVEAHLGGHYETVGTFIANKLYDGQAFGLDHVEAQSYRLRLIDSMSSVLSGGKPDEFFIYHELNKRSF